MKYLPKGLEAVGIAALMIGLVQGIYGDMWGELYLFLGGIVLFLVGRRLEKEPDRKEKGRSGNPESAR